MGKRKLELTKIFSDKKNGQKTGLKQIYDEINARDHKDLNRKIAPLKPAVNSLLLDTSYLDIEQAFNVIKQLTDKQTK